MLNEQKVGILCLIASTLSVNTQLSDRFESHIVIWAQYKGITATRRAEADPKVTISTKARSIVCCDDLVPMTGVNISSMHTGQITASVLLESLVHPVDSVGLVG